MNSLKNLLSSPLGVFIAVVSLIKLYERTKENMYASSQPYIEGGNPDKIFDPIQPYMKEEDKKETLGYSQLSQEL